MCLYLRRSGHALTTLTNVWGFSVAFRTQLFFLELQKCVELCVLLTDQVCMCLLGSPLPQKGPELGQTIKNLWHGLWPFLVCPELAGELQHREVAASFLFWELWLLKLIGAAVSYGASSSGGSAAAAFAVGLRLKVFGFGRWRSLHESSEFLKCIVRYPSSRFHSLGVWQW